MGHILLLITAFPWLSPQLCRTLPCTQRGSLGQRLRPAGSGGGNGKSGLEKGRCRRAALRREGETAPGSAAVVTQGGRGEGGRLTMDSGEALTEICPHHHPFKGSICSNPASAPAQPARRGSCWQKEKGNSS